MSHLNELTDKNFKPEPREVGLRIKEIRLKLGCSMDEFASRIDDKAKSGTVSNWETGKNLPNNKRLNRIAELGNVSAKELLFGDERTYITPMIINIALNHYDLDISNDIDTTNHIINRLYNYSYDTTEEELYIENKDILDEALLYPFDWDSEGFIQYSSLKLFEISNEINEIKENQLLSFDAETQLDIENTILNINKILTKTRKEIEKIPVNNKFTYEARLTKEIETYANKEEFDPKHD